MTFEKIVLLDFWTYNAVYFLSCFLSLVGRKIDVNTLDASKSIEEHVPRYNIESEQIGNSVCIFTDLLSNAWRFVIVLLFVVGNLMPAFFSYKYQSIQKKRDSANNQLFQVGRNPFERSKFACISL